MYSCTECGNISQVDYKCCELCGCDEWEQNTQYKPNKPVAVDFKYNHKTSSLTEDAVHRAFKIANNAIYFNDNSDYETALWDICNTLNPELNEDEIGQNYLE